MFSHAKGIIVIILMACPVGVAWADRIYDGRVKTLITVAGKDWMSPPVTSLRHGETIHISFDWMSHEYKRLVYHIDHCEADWQVSGELFESDWLQGFNDNPIDDSDISINTIYEYTHYAIDIPNDRCRLKMSGNYRVRVYDEDEPDNTLLEADFMVTENTMQVMMGITTNTDIDLNKEHQQLTLDLDYGEERITNPGEQIYVVVTQNNMEDNKRINPQPTIRNERGLRWEHCRQLIFDGGNEYRKHEVLDLSHPTMGIDFIDWDGENFNVYPFTAKARPNYLYDEDANGSFYIRNSDNEENDYTCDYALVHYRVEMPFMTDADLLIDGRWATDNDRDNYLMAYSAENNTYNITLLQKQGYYSYQFLARRRNGATFIPPTEGNFYQTENRYQVYVYYKPTGGRTWRLVAYRQAEISF